MKKIIATIAAIAALMLSSTSCGVLGGTSAQTSGSTVGSALVGLYSQYKTDGKIDLSNTSNIINLATLASGVQTLKGQTSTSAASTTANSVLSQFASGLVSGSNNLVTTTVAPTVTNTLTNLANTTDLSSIISAASKASSTVSSLSSTASEVSSTVSSLKSIFSLLGK